MLSIIYRDLDKKRNLLKKFYIRVGNIQNCIKEGSLNEKNEINEMGEGNGRLSSNNKLNA